MRKMHLVGMSPHLSVAVVVAAWAGLVLSLAGAAWAQDAREEAHKPNVRIEAHQRTFVVDEEPQVQVGLYNLARAEVTAYAFDLEQIAPHAAAFADNDPNHAGSWAQRLNSLDLSELRRVRSWSVAPEETYPDRWADLASKLPFTTPGTYVVAVSAKGVQARTWLAITGRAVLVKRSPDKVLAWVVDARTGQPVEGASVALYNARERVAVVKTERDGLVRFEAPALRQQAYVATRGGDPAFSLSSSPGTERPYEAYIFTDRPVYRPGHVVRFRGTIRGVERRRYSFPEGIEMVEVKIAAPGGATVYQEDLELNEWGTFAGEFELAPEPPLGSYNLYVTVEREGAKTVFSADFEVEAYRKPEFEVKVDIPEPHYLGGQTVPVTISADYYFGSPVSGGKVSYEVSFSGMGNRVPERLLSAAGLGIAGSAEIESGFDGEATLDDQGKYLLEVPTKYVPMDRIMSVSATVSELALRPQEGSAATRITAAKFSLNIFPETRQCLVGDTVVLRIRTEDHDGKAVSERVEVSVIETKKDREGRSYEESTKSDIETDAEGTAQVTFRPQRPGTYRVEAWGMDDERNPVFASTSFRVLEKAEVEAPYLRMTADKAAYIPGDVALVKVETNLVGCWGLMTVEGEFLHDAVVHGLGAKDFQLKVPVREAHVPGITVRLAVVRKGVLTDASASIEVPPEDKRLEVILAPDREVYEPGQKATYAVTVRDKAGHGLAAELGIGVVDTSIFAIRPDTTPSPFAFFHGPGPNRVNTECSLARPTRYRALRAQAAYLGAEMADEMALREAPAPATPMPMAAGMGKGLGGGGEPPRVRKQFADTAYWVGSLATSPDGRASFDFDMPDNLTTWRASARALTVDTSAGESKKDVTVTMPLLVRLVLPRFYVQGDEGTAAAIVHNYTGQDRSVKVALTAEGVEVQGSVEQTIQLKTDGIQRLTWPIRVLGPDKARFLISADGGPGAKDAMETTLPVLADGVKNVDAFAGVTEDSAEATVPLPAEAIASSAKIEVSLSPSLAGPIFEALDYLASYPYGCAEQTMDSFLPDVIVARTLKQLGAQRPKPRQLERYVSFGLQKLIRYQHEDGGWHWWEFDESDPYISAYIVYGLKIAADAGYVAARHPLARGVEYLGTALADEKYQRAQAYLLWALAYADIWNSESLTKALVIANDLQRDREKLDVFSRASLARALKRLSASSVLKAEAGRSLAAAAAALADELDATAKQTGVGSYWPSGTRERWSWLDNDVEVTAQVLSTLLEVKPDSQNIVPAVRWLMGARHGKSWFSTKDTAAAVLALTSYLSQRPEELAPSYTVRVHVGDRQLQEVRMSREDIFADPTMVTVPAEALKAGDNALRIEKTGEGTVYWAARLSYLVPTETAVPIAEDISVKRTYRVPTPDPITAGSQTSGSIVQVEVRLRLKENLRYAILEEPVPAGCEVVAGEDEPWRSPWDRREVWDNRLVFFFDYLRKGDHVISYVLRTETPGKYRVLPSAAALMYFPEVRGTNRPAVMRVVEEEG